MLIAGDWLSQYKSIDKRHSQTFVYSKVKIGIIPKKSKMWLHFIQVNTQQTRLQQTRLGGDPDLIHQQNGKQELCVVMAMFNIFVAVQIGFKTLWERCRIQGNKGGIVSKDFKKSPTLESSFPIFAKEI